MSLANIVPDTFSFPPAHRFSPNPVLDVGWGLLLCEVARCVARATPPIFQKPTSHFSFSL